MSAISGKSREHARLYKRLQRFLGPRITTARNGAIVALFVQTITILALLASLRNRNRTISRLASADRAITSSIVDCRNAKEDVYGLPLEEYNQPLREAIDEANYDDMAPEITGLTEQKKYTTFWGRFLRCKPAPCDIGHWPYLGDKCYYRDKVHKDKKGHNASAWSLVQDGLLYSLGYDFPCPTEICRGSWAAEMKSTRNVTYRTLMHHYKNDTPWNMEHMYIGNAYTRLNQYFGLEYMFHGGFTLTKKDKNGDDIVTNKTGSIIVRRGFTHNFCDVTFNGDVPGPETPIYIIVPYTGRLEQLRYFYKNIRELLDQGISLRVILATHGGAVHTLGASELLREMNIGLVEGELKDGSTIQVIEVEGDTEDNFSRSRALLDGLYYTPADALVFFCDVDMIIRPKFFDNCRHNAHRGHQVYYPVVYSLYPYGKKVSREHGYWRSGAYGMVCAFKSDFIRNHFWLRAPTLLKGWGMEDILLKKGFDNNWQISVFQGVEPNLLHRWHPKYCQWNTNVGSCLGTIYQNMGSQRFLATIVANMRLDVRTIKYDPPPMTFDGFKNSSDPSSGMALNEGASAHDTYPDNPRLEDLKQDYERALMNGEGGLISLFAKEAREALRAEFERSRSGTPPTAEEAQAQNVPNDSPTEQQKSTTTEQEHGETLHEEVPHIQTPPREGAVPLKGPPPGAVPVDGPPPGAVPLNGPPAANLHELSTKMHSSEDSGKGENEVEPPAPHEPVQEQPPPPPGTENV